MNVMFKKKKNSITFKADRVYVFELHEFLHDTLRY